MTIEPVAPEWWAKRAAKYPFHATAPGKLDMDSTTTVEFTSCGLMGGGRIYGFRTQAARDAFVASRRGATAL